MLTSRVWIAGRTGLWNVASNWVDGSAPVTSEAAIIESGDAIISGLTIEGEFMVLGGSSSATSAALTLNNATIEGFVGSSGEFLATLHVSGGTVSAPLQASVNVSGGTSFDGELFVTTPNGSLTISVAAGSATVTDGTNTQRLAMLGSYVALNFSLATDGHGGTLVLDPPVSSGAGIATPH